MSAARYQVIARTSGRGLLEHRRLNIDASGIVQIVTHGARDAMTQQQAIAHLLAPQIEVPITQADLFADMFMFIQLKRQRIGAVQNLELMTQQLDVTRLQMDVGRPARTDAHQTRDLEDVFVADPLRHGENARPIRIEHDLQQSFAIAKVDEDDAAMAAPPMAPPGHDDHLTDQRLADLTAIMSAHKLMNRKGSARC